MQRLCCNTDVTSSRRAKPYHVIADVSWTEQVPACNMLLAIVCMVLSRLRATEASHASAVLWSQVVTTREVMPSIALSCRPASQYWRTDS